LNFAVPVPDAWLRELEEAFGPPKRRARVSLPKGVRRKAGFPLDAVVLAMVDELRIQTPVEVRFGGLDDPPQAMLTRFPGGPLEIRLPTRKTIRRLMPELTEREVTAKMVSQVAEEACHYAKHETCHNKRVVGCTLRLMRRHIPKRDLKTPYIREKVAILRASPKSPDRCPA
jgi:hypothetical protein